MKKLKLTPYLATAIAEGFCEGENANYWGTKEQQIEAWQYLHDTKLAYKLQGWFGRTAQNLIEQGIINK
jgi:hypothetical protein